MNTDTLNKNNRNNNNHINKFDDMHKGRVRADSWNNPHSPYHHHHHQQQQQHQHYHQQQKHHPRPDNLFTTTNLNYENNNIQDFPPGSPTSDEDNSPTEMNNCRRLLDKPPLVKRLTMSFMRTTEENRPLVQNSPTFKSLKKDVDGWGSYINESNYDTDKIISSKFGESCWKALTPVLDNRKKEICGFNKKKYFLRETSSANSSPKISAATRLAKKRIDCISQREQDELKEFAWFQAGIPREISLEVLLRKNPGEFLVRASTTKPGCFALSLRVPPPGPKVAHYLIVRTSRGYKIKGFNKEFSSLRALITHHSVMPEQLPVPLELSRPANVVARRRHLDDLDVYGSLSDFQQLMLQT